MFPVSDGCWSLPFPPSKIQPGSLPSKASCPYPLSFRPKCLLSVRFSVVSRPPSAVATLRWLPILLVSCPASRMQVCTPPPPRPVRLVVLGLGVGGGAKETAPPAMVWSPSTRRQASPGIAWFRRRSSSLLDSLSAHLSVCPPPPLSPYNCTCPSTLPPNGRVFSWLLRAPLPHWTRPSCRLL